MVSKKSETVAPVTFDIPAGPTRGRTTAPNPYVTVLAELASGRAHGEIVDNTAVKKTLVKARAAGKLVEPKVSVRCRVFTPESLPADVASQVSLAEGQSFLMVWTVPLKSDDSVGV